jgi:Ca-activated chloride channel family protein
VNVPAVPELTLAAPSWLWLAPLALAAVLRAHRRAPAADVAAAPLLRAPAGAAPLPRTWRGRAAAVPGLAAATALLLVVLALARPVERVSVPAPPPGRDVLLCLDVSSSMAATDLAAERTRLDVARELAAAFVRARVHDRVGFLTFARYHDLRCPVTLDHDAVIELLQPLQLVERDGPEDATAIGAAVATAALALQRVSTAPTPVLVVVTDGEENVATALTPDEIAPLHAAQWCAAAGIRVHTIAVGRGNVRADGGVDPLDTTAVEQLARTTGGRFFRAADARELAAVYAAIDRAEASVVQPPGTRERELFPLAAVAALLAWGIGIGAAAALRRAP